MRFRKALAVLLCLCALGSAAAWADEGYSQNIAKAVKGFLLTHIEGGAKMFTFDKKEGVFRTTLTGEGEARLLGCMIVVTGDHFRTYVVGPIGVDPKDPAKLAAMAEFLCRANYGVFNGNFEMDYDDGEIRYKSYVDCPGGMVPSEDQIGDSILVGINMQQIYLPGIKDVLFNGTHPKDALDKLQK